MLDVIIHCSKILHLVQSFNRTAIDISPFVELSGCMRICSFLNPVQQQYIKMNKNEKYSVSKKTYFILFAHRVFKAQDRI
jgi:hypothetical protein